jgi:cytochrome c nitrite reductase small subunit
MAVGKVSRVTSYLSDDPEACVNCHVMRPQYASWQHSSHASATCNDCHVPHDTILNAYAFKARDGLYHSVIFTLRLEPQVIRMSRGAVPVVEGNCRRCHGRVIEEVSLRRRQPGDHRCWDCHREVPHGRVRSLSAAPRVMSPQLPPALQPQVPSIGGRKPRPPQAQQGPQGATR